ncbi:MAG: ATP-binding protein [Candidatus Dactylopiibacterium sp.]|nr:ATP-binding protein [Candidatus Dactylopiibacterium sp.]
MRNTVRHAAIIAVLLGTVLPAIGVGTYLVRYKYSSELRRGIQEQLPRSAHVIATGVSENLWALDRDAVAAMLDAVMQDPAVVAVEITDARLGRFLMREHPERRSDPPHHIEWPIHYRDERIGAVRLELTEAPLRRELREEIVSIIGLLALQLVVSVTLILYVLQRRLGTPLQKLGDEARELARGQLERPIVPQREDEIGQVEAQLEITRRALRSLIDTLEHKNRALEDDLTERRRVEAELLRLATVVRLTQNPIALAAPDATLHWFNEAFAARFDSPGRPALGRALGDVIGGNAGRDWASRQAVEQALAREESLSGLELAWQGADERLSSFSLELQPIHDESRTLRGWALLLNDVTERRQTSEALSALARLGAEPDQGAFLSALLAAVMQGCGASGGYIARHTPQGLNVLAGIAPPGGTLQTGLHAGNGLLTRYADTDGALIVRRGANEILSQEPVCRDCRAEALALAALRDARQRTTGHLVLFFDSAPAAPAAAQSLAALGAARASAEFERLEVLEALRQSEQKFFSIFQHVPIPLCVLREADGICLDINPGCSNLFGYPRELLIGSSLPASPLCPDAATRVALQDLLERRFETSVGELALRRLDGDLRACQIHVRRVSMNGEPSLLVALVDLSPLLAAKSEIVELNRSLEQRVAERTRDLAASKAELEHTLTQLRRTLDELVHAEKLAALGSLVAGIAHELNTPIGNSLMMASTLHDLNAAFGEQVRSGLRRSALDLHMQETASAADILVRNLQRAAELITSFKQVAVDQTSSQRRAFDLADVASEILVTMQPVLRKRNYGVTLAIPPGIRMESYPGPLGQVLANLLNNALLHAFEGRETGQIQLEASLLDDDRVRLDCRDDGVGIRAANLKRIFDPFFTTRLGRDGSGLGLNIVHNIVTGVLGGEIEVTSEENHGACFTLRLPRVAPRTAESPAETA